MSLICLLLFKKKTKNNHSLTVHTVCLDEKHWTFNTMSVYNESSTGCQDGRLWLLWQQKFSQCNESILLTALRATSPTFLSGNHQELTYRREICQICPHSLATPCPLWGIRVGREVYAQTLQQVGGRSGKPSLTAEGLQQVGDQVEVHVKRLNLLLCLLHPSLHQKAICGRGFGRPNVQTCLVIILQKEEKK